jgi:hypothetical protein
MKLLLCLPSSENFELLLEHINRHNSKPIPFKSDSFHFLFSTKFMQHDLDVCYTGNTPFEVNFKVAKAIQNKYHLALDVRYCLGLKPEMQPGTIVKVIKEKPFILNEYGVELYDSSRLNQEDYPHFKNAFINMNNSYMNIFLDFEKVVSVSANMKVDDNLVRQLATELKADTLTYTGIDFVYPCMFERQPFYQIYGVSRNLAIGAEDIDLSKNVLNETLIDILQKI